MINLTFINVGHCGFIINSRSWDHYVSLCVDFISEVIKLPTDNVRADDYLWMIRVKCELSVKVFSDRLFC